MSQLLIGAGILAFGFFAGAMFGFVVACVGVAAGQAKQKADVALVAQRAFEALNVPKPKPPEPPNVSAWTGRPATARPN